MSANTIEIYSNSSDLASSIARIVENKFGLQVINDIPSCSIGYVPIDENIEEKVMRAVEENTDLISTRQVNLTFTDKDSVTLRIHPSNSSINAINKLGSECRENCDSLKESLCEMRNKMKEFLENE